MTPVTRRVKLASQVVPEGAESVALELFEVAEDQARRRVATVIDCCGKIASRDLLSPISGPALRRASDGDDDGRIAMREVGDILSPGGSNRNRRGLPAVRSPLRPHEPDRGNDRHTASAQRLASRGSGQRSISIYLLAANRCGRRLAAPAAGPDLGPLLELIFQENQETKQ